MRPATPYDQAPYSVRFGWGLQGMEALAPADVVVIVDVLSFCTTVDVAVAAGAEVLPYRYGDQGAAAFAADHDAVLAVNRREASTEHPYSLSPASVRDVRPGTRLVLPSLNGSNLSVAAASSTATVIAGCLRNRAVVAAVAARHGSVNVIAAGERWPDGSLRPAFEDLVGAGAIVDVLGLDRSPEAGAAAAAFHTSHADMADRLVACATGRELEEAGYLEDVLIAGEIDASTQVPTLTDGRYAQNSSPAY